MVIIGCDFHPSWEQVCWLDTETGETADRREDLFGLLASLEQQIAPLDRAVAEEAQQNPEARLLRGSQESVRSRHWPSC